MTSPGSDIIASNTCDSCGITAGGIGWFAKFYRQMQLRKKLPDPGNLCGTCAAKNDTANRARAAQDSTS